MNSRLLTHLRHVDLPVPDYDKQLDFYAGVWGLTPWSRTPVSPSLPPRAAPSSTSYGCARPPPTSSPDNSWPGECS